MKKQKIEKKDLFKKYVTKDIYFSISRYLSLKDMVNIALCGRSYYFNSVYTCDYIWKPIVKKLYDILKVYKFPKKNYFYYFINLPKTFSFERWESLENENYLKSVLNVYFKRSYKDYYFCKINTYNTTLRYFEIIYFINDNNPINYIKFIKYHKDPKVYLFHGHRLIELIYEEDLNEEYERLFLLF